MFSGIIIVAWLTFLLRESMTETHSYPASPHMHTWGALGRGPQLRPYIRVINLRWE